jgi:hypothetical protein
MAKQTQRCGYLECTRYAVYAGHTVVPVAKVYRCAEHGGHHDFTERWRGGRWVRWKPLHARDKRFSLKSREAAKV